MSLYYSPHNQLYFNFSEENRWLEVYSKHGSRQDKTPTLLLDNIKTVSDKIAFIKTNVELESNIPFLYPVAKGDFNEEQVQMIISHYNFELFKNEEQCALFYVPRYNEYYYICKPFYVGIPKEEFSICVYDCNGQCDTGGSINIDEYMSLDHAILFAVGHEHPTTVNVVLNVTTKDLIVNKDVDFLENFIREHQKEFSLSDLINNASVDNEQPVSSLPKVKEFEIE